MSSTNNSSPTPIIHTKKALVEKNILFQPSKRDIFPWLHLPRELRDTIYRHSITAGNLAILRISKLVTEEASQLLSKHAVLRLNLAPFDPTGWVHGGNRARFAPAVGSVQRVEFRLDANSGAFPFNVDVISGFAGDGATRESCVVTVDYGKEASPPYNIDRDRLYLLLAGLTGFKSLVFKIVVGRYQASEFEGLLTEEQFQDVFPYESRLVSHHRKGYQTVQRFLECSLGPATFDDSVEGHHLEFHPLEPVPKDLNRVYVDFD